jgi:phosphoribosylamine--glycine ligase
MNILIVGGGAREHAIAWKLSQSPRDSHLFIAPGNAGTITLGTNLPIETTNIDGLATAVHQHNIHMTIVGPEVPLAEGIVDRFQKNAFPIFGPTESAAKIETSKAFAKEFMQRHDIPCANGVAFDSYNEALRFLGHISLPVVIKADGLAEGKGVTIAHTHNQAKAALDDSMNRMVFGQSGATVVLEEFLDGHELSVFTFTDGRVFSPLIAACDYKRVGERDQGPNTGGMGSYSPPEFWERKLALEAESKIFRRVVDGLAQEGRRYKGVLYGGLIITKAGLRVLEFNARLGDPETQVILPLLKTDFLDVITSVVNETLNETQILWSKQACVGVVMTSSGYPGKYEIGFRINGLPQVEENDALVFHSGTQIEGSAVTTSKGRVLTVVGQADTISEARDMAYTTVRKINFQGAYYRRDIALRATKI